MTRRYTYATSLGWGGDEPTAEIDVTLSYAVDWGQTAEVSDLRVEAIDERPADASPDLLAPIMEKLEDIEADLFPHLIYHALETDAERQHRETQDAF